MLLSMTGFGKSIANIENQSIEIQIKSLNSKSLDLFIKLPSFLREKEVEIRAIVNKRVERGKVELNISNDSYINNKIPSINNEVAKFYLEQIKDMEYVLDIKRCVDYVPVLLKMPYIFQSEKDNITPEEWGILFESINNAVDKLIDWRKSEGSALENDIVVRIKKISSLIEQVIPYETTRKERIKNKLFENIKSISENVEYDKNRFEQEIIYYLDKIDINEEIVRAQKHCEYFLETVNENNSNGKKLTFISQEILRELNTMGVKCNDVDIQKLTVEMKDEIEKVREQLFNIL